mmetsp:Transcript_12695/g.21877  ORF Transcript_12695/g.21877 Transcript_12695/m.21877 type:complete len:116 (+) Transcript_12695:539-886(+)
MPLSRIAQRIGNGSPEHCHVAQGNGVLGQEPQNKNVNGHKYASAADPATSGDDKPKSSTKEADNVRCLKRDERVMIGGVVVDDGGRGVLEFEGKDASIQAGILVRRKERGRGRDE